MTYVQILAADRLAQSSPRGARGDDGHAEPEPAQLLAGLQESHPWVLGTAPMGAGHCNPTSGHCDPQVTGIELLLLGVVPQGLGITPLAQGHPQALGIASLIRKGKIIPTTR